VKGYHYSSERLKVGDIITSDAQIYTTFQSTWDIYARVAKELGKYFPVSFGHAYPTIQERMNGCGGWWYELEADAEFVTPGNFDFSLMAAQDACAPSAIRRENPHLKTLDERKAAREMMIEQWARKYFTLLDNPDKIELISDQWVIVKAQR